MKARLLKTVRIMLVYTSIILILSIVGLIENMEFNFWLIPFNMIIIYDLLTDYPYAFSSPPEEGNREIMALFINFILISMLHFLAFLPKRTWLRRTLTATTTLIVLLWYLLIFYSLIAISAG